MDERYGDMANSVQSWVHLIINPFPVSILLDTTYLVSQMSIPLSILQQVRRFLHR
jgi:hypothetical protein